LTGFPEGPLRVDAVEKGILPASVSKISQFLCGYFFDSIGQKRKNSE
jgi:hypothetical protein